MNIFFGVTAAIAIIIAFVSWLFSQRDKAARLVAEGKWRTADSNFQVSSAHLLNSAREADEFKQLFEIGSAEYSKSQEKIQELLVAGGEKDIMIERASLALNAAGDQLGEKGNLISALDEKLRFSENQYSKLLSQKKSSEVRTGLIAEQIAPFLEDYPGNPSTAKFIGDPIDFVHFDDHGITFIEVKSGKSQLSKKQRHIRDLIKDGKVEFIIYRVKGDDPSTKDKDNGDNRTD